MIKRTIFIASTLLLVSCSTSGDAKSSRAPHPDTNPDATVVVMEYADLECPACRAAHAQIVVPIIQKYKAEIRYEFKHFPLRSIHRFALDAAESAECAADQGKFWEYIDLAYEKQEDLSYDALLVWAEELELDVSSFEKCWKSRRKKNLVLADYNEGRKKEVQGTPTFYVNDTRVDPGFDTLSEAIEAELGEMRKRL
jgi:protein-disulfide isomerase